MPNVEIRPARPEEMEAVEREGSRQLALPREMFGGMAPEWTMCAFVDGQVATTYAFWPLQVRLNGRAVPMAGVTQVSTHPAHRRRGYLRAVTRTHFEEMHERGEVAIAGLHPAWMAIYQRYGYGTVNVRHTYRVEPRHLVFHHPLSLPGRVREVDVATEFGLLVDVYRRFREDRTGMIHRGRPMWDAGPLQAPSAGQREVVLAYEEDGEPQGYVIYHHGRSPDARPAVLRIMDFFALTPQAYQALWGVIGGYDNIDQVLWDNAPVDDPLPLMMVEPRLLNLSARDGIMARLVTVPTALAKRPYAEATTLRFDLIDAFCEWNAGRWNLATSAEGGEATRIDGQDVDLALTPDTLASLVFGRYTPSEAYRAGLLERVRDRAVLARWDAALRLAHPPYEAEHTW
ncbi:MAG: GNAT family N-acetyltransferase [Dehalococcoidia bacterium]|nr:GNAT family N-acetyltransferase [Dehalococcoidia bacterium]